MNKFFIKDGQVIKAIASDFVGIASAPKEYDSVVDSTIGINMPVKYENGEISVITGTTGIKLLPFNRPE